MLILIRGSNVSNSGWYGDTIHLIIETNNTSALLGQCSGVTEPLPTKVHLVSEKNKVENIAQVPDPIDKNEKIIFRNHVEVNKAPHKAPRAFPKIWKPKLYPTYSPNFSLCSNIIHNTTIYCKHR